MPLFFHRLVLGELSTNCYVLADEATRNAVVIDAPSNADKILKLLDKNGLRLKFIFLTHAHFDHIMALNELQQATEAEIFLHTGEEKYLNDSSLNLSYQFNKQLPKIENYRLINDGDVLSLDSLRFEVIHTPGHTEGSVCYLIDNILISGDTLFSGSVGRTDFPSGSFETEINSIEKKLMCLSDELKVYPGHGFSTTIGKQRKENPYLI